jgi:hypothetical protein
MNTQELEKGYYWILIQAIFEEGWTVGYYSGRAWSLHGLEDTSDWSLIYEVGDRVQEPPEKINYT